MNKKEKEKEKKKKDDKDLAISNVSELLSLIADESAVDGEKDGESPSRILVIDDDEDVRLLLRDLLEESFYTVDTASCGEEALKMIRVSTYDLVVTDLRMDGMHGLEVIKEVKAIDPGIDVIVMTGYASVNSLKILIASR